ncbi:MAG: type VI secretion system membrane subunit TssM [Amphritea sp.]
MAASKQAIWPFVLFTLVFALLLCVVTWGLAWWDLSNPLPAVLSAVSGLLLGSLISGLVWIILRKRAADRPSDEQKAEQQQLLFQQRQLVSSFDKIWQNSQRSGRDTYRTPWYLFLTDHIDSDTDLLRQMGFEEFVSESYANCQALPISFWVSDAAVLVGLHSDQDPKLFTACLETLLKRFKFRRPSQAANGVLLGMRAADLLDRNQDELEQIAKQQRVLLREINQRLGLNLPVYSVFTEMAEVMDYCQCFSTFDDARLEEPQGAMMPVGKAPGYDPSWFQTSFDELQKNLAAQISPALKAQLNATYRDAILIGPYQFSLLRSELDCFFRTLYLDNQFEEQPLNFRGYFFTSATGQASPVDRLSMLLASQLGFTSLPVPEPTSISRSLFAKQLFRRTILAESNLVGVNQRRERFNGLLRITYSGGLCLVFGIFLWLLKANFDYYQDLDNQALQQLDNYKKNLLVSKPNRDDLTATIFNLSELRDIGLIYSAEKPWYVQSWLPNPSIDKAVSQTYQKELEDVLLVALRDYLFKDLYVYNKLEDNVKTLELFNLQQVLYSSQRENIKPLMEYYVSSLQEEGEGDVSTLERFRELLQDLLKSGVVPPADDEPLIELVKTSLSSEDLSDLLYQHILQQPEFSRRQDMRSGLGQSYAKVLRFNDGFGGYLVPFIFTREGFQALMSGTGFQFATEAIKDYEGVVGRISGKSELSRINRKLKQRYVEDYISYWQRFATNVQWQPTNGWSLAQQQLTIVADPLFSPLKRFYSLISYHTDLSSVVGISEEGATPEGGKQQQLLEERKQSAQKMADAIGRPFVSYQQLVKLDDTGQTHFDLAMRQITQTQEWLKQAALSNSRGRYFLDKLVEAEIINPLAQMQSLADSYSEKLLREVLIGTADQLNQLAMEDVRTLLNEDWNRDVVGYYNNQIRSFYPFSPDAQLEVSLKAFKGFFGPFGAVASFGDDFLSYFNVRDNNHPVLNSFLPHKNLVLDESFWKAVEEARRIRNTFFTADKLGLQFSIRAKVLSAGLEELSLHNERPLYVYRNGPSLWAAMSWPIADSESRDIELQLKGIDDTLMQQEFSGIWSWFRLADSLQGTLLQEGTTSSLVARHGEQSAKLLVRVEGDSNPFVVGYFDNLKLPDTI